MRRIFSFLLCLWFWVPVIGQNDYYRKAIFRHLSVNEGLAHRTVNTIAQDAEGRLWIGTNNGLNRYDGQEMEVYRRDIQDSLSLPGSVVFDLLPGQQGQVWVITETRRLSRYQPHTNGFVTPQLLDQETGAEIRLRDMAEDQAGRLWILSTANRLYRLPASTTATSPLLLPAIELSILPDQSITRIVIDPFDRFWIETVQQGLYLVTIQEKATTLIRHFPNSSGMRILGRENNGQLWFARSQREIYRASFDADIPSVLPFYNLDEVIGSGSINTVVADKNGVVWVALYGGGLVKLLLTKQGFTYTHYPGLGEGQDDLTNTRLHSLFIDRYNVLWIGSEAGLFSNHLYQKPFYLIGKQHANGAALTDNIIHAIYRDRHIWIGTRNGLSVIDTTTRTFHNFFEPGSPLQSEGNITALQKDRNGNMWVGTYSGLFMAPQVETLTDLQLQEISFRNSGFPQLEHTNIVGIGEDEWGRIWLGTFNQGIYILTAGSDGDFHRPSVQRLDLPGNFLLSHLYKDAFENTIWAGTRSRGLLRISNPTPDQQQVQLFQSRPGDANSLSFQHTNPIIKTDTHTLWVGTIGGGLNKLTFHSADSVSFQHYTTHQGLPDNTIHSIQADAQGHLWLGTTVGLTRFDPDDESFTHYDWRDGLQGNLFIVNASFKDQHGRLYFGGPDGLNFFHPKDILSERSPPDIRITGLKIINTPVAAGERLNGRVVLPRPISQLDSLELKEKENDLTFDIRAIHTAAPNKNRLSYRLLGQQAAWIDAGSGQAVINYSNLRPGKYTLEVKATNGDGVPSAEVRRMYIRVWPYWYKTQLAYLVYGLLFLLALWQFRRFVILQSNLRNNLKIARIEREKDLEIANIKTRFFNNMTHELRTPLTLIQGPVEELVYRDDLAADTRRNYHHLIHRNAQKLLQLVNRLLDFRKSESAHFTLAAIQADFIPFAHEVFLAFQHLTHEQRITYSFDSAADELPLYFDPEKMEILLGNLLSNAIKYSDQGDEVNLRIRTSEADCILEVADTGRGMRPEEVDLIFDRYYQIAHTESSRIIGTGIGLSMVKTIAALHHGTVEVETEINKGSTFIIRLPLGKTHLHADQILDNTQTGEDIEQYVGPAPVPYAPTNSEEPAPNHPLSLLIVEDNPEIRTFIHTIFAKNFRIQEAANGEEGLAKLKKNLPDLIISDIMMDKMDGIALCTRVKEDADTAHIPVILLTARTSNVYQVDGLSSGADAYITKPFNAQVLQAQVDSLLKSRAALKTYYTNRITLGPKAIEVDSEELVFLEQLISIIEENINEEYLTAEYLAGQMAMSHSTLYRKIKSYTGESINSFIRSIRLKQAAQLLTDSEMNISEVAYRVGFSDVDYFRKCFKKQFGVTPSGFVGNT